MAERRAPSVAQRRLWFLEQLEPGQPVYHVPFGVRFDGVLDVAALRAALERVGAHHAALRTTFDAEDGLPVAVVTERAGVELPVVDLDGGEEALRQFAAAELERPFDLARGPLVRTTLARLAADVHVLVGSAHAIVFDGPSAAIFFRELGTAYGAEGQRRRTNAEGTETDDGVSTMPCDGRQPGRRTHGDADTGVAAADAADLSWWKAYLHGAPPVLELPGDRPRPPEQSYRAAVHTFALAPEVTAGVHALATRLALTPFAVLLAAFTALLQRLSGHGDVVVGTPGDGAARAHGIGPFADTLALRCDLSGNPTFAKLVERVGRAHAAARAHGGVTFERLVEELQPERSRAFAPLFQQTFALAGATAAPLMLPGLTLSLLDLPSGTSKVDFELSLVPCRDGLAGTATHALDLFDGATAARITGHYHTLLAAAVAAPDERLARLPLLTPGERETLLVAWNDTGAGAGEACLHELFAAQARATPDAPAAICGAERLTYRELDARADTWAARLVDLGVGPDVPVGIALTRSLEMYVAVLAVLKAGGTYVPLDPEYPRERLAFMLGDVRAPVLLTERALVERLPQTDARVVRLDLDTNDNDATEHKESTTGVAAARERGDGSALARGSLRDLRGFRAWPPARPDNLAYVIYTSGSTGRPKGVALPHRALTNLVAWQARVLRHEHGARTAQFASLSFDVSCQEMFTTWAAGGALVLVDEETRRDPHALLRLLAEQRVTRLFLPFVALQQLAEEAGQARLFPPALREVITAGEQLQITPALVRLFEALPAATLHNHYGPSESHVVTAHTLRGEPASWPALPPIGRPIAAARVHVVDAHGEPVPPGVTGELLLGGACLARGYAERPDLTAERFIPDPFARVPGGRLYRTGDLARYRANGEVEFLGRADSQVKIRGFRVEPGEVEAALARHPRVRDVALSVHAGLAGRGKVLVGYVVPSEPQAPTPDELRAFLLERLAEYMVPGLFVVLDALPKTPSGKIDRRALPAPDLERPLEATGDAPRTPIEEAVAEVWRDLLGLRAVGLRDDFFALGGHSLVATQMVSRLRRLFGIELPLRVVFEARTLGALSAQVEAARREGPAPAPAPFTRVAREGALALSFAQQRLWFLDQLRPGQWVYNVPFELTLRGTLDPDALRFALEQIVARHEALRTTFTAVGDEPCQIVGAPTFALACDDLSHVAPGERAAALARLAGDETRAPFDLARGPLLRARLARLAGDEHVLLLTLHHIVADGWSAGVLLRELGALYRARVSGRDAVLPGLEFQYADFAAWQRGWMQGDVLAEQLAYWRARFADGVPVLELPADRPRPAVQSFDGARVDLCLSRDTTERLKALARREGATLFMVLLAAFEALLQRYTGQDDVVIGTPIAGRNRAEVEGLIGFFVNTLVLRTDLRGDPSFCDLLARVKDETLRAYAHQDLPLERLVEELQPERDLSRNPLFQVVFASQDTSIEAPTLPGVAATVRELDTGTAKFDLLLSTEETPAGLRGTLEYSTDLFDAERMLRMAAHLRTLLEGVATDASRRLSELPLLSAAERRQVLVDCNPAPAGYPRDASLAEVFAAQVRATPGATAVECGDERLTYARLDARAEEVAARLRERGVGPEVPVGIVAERSLAMIVGLLAIVKAGGAYVPLDPTYPRERLALLIADAGLELVLGGEPENAGPAENAVLASSAVGGLGGGDVEHSEASLDPECTTRRASVAPRGTGGAQPPSLDPAGRCRPHAPAWDRQRRGKAEVALQGGEVNDASAWLGSVAPRTSRAPREHAVFPHSAGQGERGSPSVSAGPDNLAYIMYTSGTTGQPKGVRVTQRAVVRLVKGQSYATFGPHTVFLQFAPLAFDASTFEIWGALLNGGRLVIYPGASASLEELGDSIRRHGVTTLWLTAGLFHQMVAERLDDLAGVQELLAGGDVLAPSSVLRALAALPGCRVINGYGPTENTTFTCCHVMRDAGEVGVTVPIGRPIAHTRVYVLDAWMRPVPLGVPGELYAGGDGLARDYLGHPAVSAACFVPDPFGGEPGARLYRTGDYARWRGDGVLEFLGRRDAQVKVRGYRIETGEIEAVLRAHPALGAVAVVAREDVPGDKRLVAYVVPREGEAPDARELRAFLKQRLPEPLLPSAFIALAALPLTPNGKLDRRALPVPDAAEPVGELDAPRTPVEEILASIWAQVLGRERVGRHQDFFELGGHSLLATQVVSRVRQALRVELPLRALFEAPTVASLAVSVEAQRRQRPDVSLLPIARVPRTDALPLSFAQQRLWFFDQLLPGSALYNVPAPLRLEGPLDVDALRTALHAIVQRHEGLRTTFPGIAGQPRQVVAEETRVALERIDLGHLPMGEREHEAQRLAEDDARRPFDLAVGPLVRATLVRLDRERHVLLLTLHHIISDGWSMDVLLHELAALYAGFTRGRPARLPDLPVQYADFAQWQREWLQGDVLERQLAYWKKRLGDNPPPLELPTDRPRPAVESFRGALEPVALSRAVTHRLEALARREGATLFMLLLAAFEALLHRYTGLTDVVVGTPVAGRNRPEVEGLVGFFINTLVLRTDLSGDPTFHDLVGRVRAEALEAYAHQDVPFERLVEELHPERDLSRNPLFQVMFVLRTAPFGALELPGLRTQLLEADSGTSKLDLTLALEQTDEGLRGALEYSTDLFERERVQRLAAHFVALVESVATDPQRRLSQVELLSPAERTRLLVEWAVPRLPPQDEACLHELFEAQAARTPEAPALVHGRDTWSYARLNCRANRLARHLRRLGVGPEVRVGVCTRRTPQLVAGMLAVLKAGGAYVPLDPNYPAERVTYMLDDSGATLVLAEGGLPAALAGAQVRVVRLDEEFAHESEAPLAPVASPRGLAYLIYTSGSTGRPKGVAIEHRSAVVFAHWARGEFGDHELRGVLAATSICFDLSIFELFVTLAWGGTVYLAEDALELPLLPRRDEVTLVNTVPSAIAELVRQQALPASVRTVNLAGEPLKGALVERVYASGPVARVLNLYGPSEDTTYSTFARVPRGAETPTVGRPIANTQAYLLDRYGALVPPGVPGELYLGGDGLARGYLGRPELTAEKFVPDPFGGERGARLYRTGDLARYRSDGELDFLGRIDHQVKVRGFRIELGEIEAALQAQAAVGESVVLVREDVPGDRRLVAYVVPREGAIPDARELRAALKQRLPEYMLPSAFVVLAALPRTPNGKLDRRALPVPEAPVAPTGEQGGAPRTPFEEVLASIWAQVLGRERVGVHDDFFGLGGHSLLAVQVVSRVRQALGVELPLRVLFEAPTVATLAERVAALRPAQASGPPSSIPRVPRGGALPLSFAQQRLWFFEQLLPGAALYNVPCPLQLDGRLDPGALRAALREIVWRHEALRTTFLSVAGEPRQVVADEADVELRQVDLESVEASRREAEVRRRLEEEARQPFDLARGPLLRATLLRLDAERHVLLLTLHHIVSDGWSLDVLVRELHALYAACAAGRPSPLPALPVHYADFAQWQRAWLQGPALESQLAWWRGRLGGGVPVLELPADRPRPAVESFRGAHARFALSPEVSAQLQALARREGVTLFMLLLAAFQALLQRYTGQTDIVVGTPVAGRTRAELEGLIGFFVNTLVLRTDLRDDPPFAELLGRVREETLSAYAHQDLPFERLVEELQPERHLGRNPLFQVMFVLERAPFEPLELPGLTLRPLPPPSDTSKFDLTLALQESAAGLHGTLEYATDLFDARRIERMATHLCTLLAGVAADPSRRLSELPLMSAAERRQVLVECNPAPGEFPRDASLADVFAAQVRATPDATAVVCGDERLTYAELSARADVLSARLREHGVGPEVTVGVSSERSLDMIVGLLAIVKAGGAYVPLDPAYPRERLALLIADAGVEVILGRVPESAGPTESAGLASNVVGGLGGGDVEPSEASPDPECTTRRASVAPRGTGGAKPPSISDASAWLGSVTPRTSLAPRPLSPAHGGEGWGEGERPVSGSERPSPYPSPRSAGRGERGAPTTPPGPDNLAYVMYTSGTTGQPKGVRVTQRAVVRLVKGQSYATFGPHTVFLQFAPLAFDASTFEIWGALLNGGCLVVWPAQQASLEELGAAVRRHGVTTLWLTTGLFHQMVEHRLDDLAGVKELLTGGDVVAPDSARRAVRGLPGCRVSNGYGPTENTTFTTIHALRAEHDFTAPLPIGRPIAHTRVYVLDAWMQPVPPGVPGELYAGGDGLARDYLGRPDASAASFVPDPWSGEPGARLYRTGDYARWRGDGVLEFLGRRDAQVKVRGFRIEPGEIETALRGHAALSAAAVVAREDVPGDKRLVAYVVPREGQAVDARELRAFLKQRVPDHMLPAAFVALAALPLTPNGKLDRRALPAPETAEASADDFPRTPVEEVLASIWAQVLGRERVGVRQNFFELGGHSLLATQVASRVRQALRVELPLRTLFEAPTVAGLAERLEALHASQRPGAALVPRPAPRAGAAPLSFAQRRLWFFDQLLPGSTLYNVPCPLWLEGHLDVEALRAALREVIWRHAALRTTFVSIEGQPQPVVADAPDVALPVFDLEPVAAARRTDEALRLAQDDARRPFDLARGPLLRAALARLGDERHLLVLTLHHVACDGWSLGVLARELGALYDAFAQGQPSPLPEPPLQYADYARWQQDFLRGERVATQLAYWKQRLGGVLPVLDLPADRPRPPLETFRGAHHHFSLPRELAQRLQSVARSQGVTLFMLLLAAFDTLLQRYTDRTDVVVGTPIAGRTQAEVEGLIGFFVNTLVLRTDLSGDPTFVELLERVKEVTLSAYAHQDLPFERLVEELHLARDFSRNPLFQVMFVLQSAPFGPLELRGLRLTPAEVGGDTSKFDLTLSMEETPEGLSGTFEYCRDLFDAERIARLAAHFGTLLEGVAADPRRRLSELPLMTPDEQLQALVLWNDTAAALPAERCVPELVAEWATHTPEALAVAAPDARLSYAELVLRARAVARHLRARGVATGARVGLYAERSAALVVGLLGVLMAGAACVPLDPELPDERLRGLAHDAGLGVVLTLARRHKQAPFDAGVEWVDLEDAARETHADAEPVASSATPGDVAYVIYTWGSTGAPKGVEIEHRALLNLVLWHRRVYRMGPGERGSQLAPMSFDASTWELWSCLASGASVHLADDATRLQPQRLRDWLLDEGITVAFVPTLPCERLLREAWPRQASLRVLLTGGDRPAQRPPAGLPFTLVDHAGASEATLVTTARVVAPEDGAGPSPSLGHPIDNQRVYVLDRQLRPVPVGVPGELYVGGAGLARGYLGRPALTAEKFVPDPFAPEPGARLYATGDRVRWRADGELELVGRAESQVMLRGSRIEPGEIEAALRAHAGVAEAVVAAREDAPGEQRLVAYVVPRATAPTARELREFLATRLPDSLLPAGFVALAALPLTPQGKLDRRALPAPEVPVETAAESTSGSSTPVEEILQAIWAEVLGVAHVGPRQDFFELGGHSLLATQVVSRARQALRVDLPLRVLFEAPTIQALAARVEALRPAPGAPRNGLARVTRTGPPPLSFAQQRLWFFDQLLPGSPLYNLPSPFRLTGALEVSVLHAALRESVRRHESLRTTFVASAGEPRQVIADEAQLELPVIDLEPLPEATREVEAQRLADADAHAPFDLARGPLLRTTLLRLGPESHVLLLTLHHIIADGWSMDVLVREVAALYDAFLEQRPSPLPEPALQYADFAQWQRGWLRGDVLESQLGYWRRQLAGAPETLRLPVDHAHPSGDDVAGAVLGRALPAALCEALRGLARRSGATLFMLMLAAFDALVLRRTGQEDIVVGTPVAGRNRTELEGLIGFFVNTLVLRSDLSGRPTFNELLRRVREVTLDAYAHQDVPFEKLVEELHPERRAGRTPLFQVMFGFHDRQRPLPHLGRVTLAPLETGGITSPFDLTFYVTDAGHELELAIEYRTALFEPATVERLLADYQTLLEEVVADPERRIEAELPDAQAAATAAPPRSAESPPRERDAAAERAEALAARRARLSDEKRALLAKRLRGGA